MATILSFYTRLLAAVSAVLAVLWGVLAYHAPIDLNWMFGSETLVWGPALWFLYLTLRFGHPRSAERFYLSSVLPWGRAKILLFGVLAIASMALGGIVGSVIFLPGLADPIGAWAPIAALAFAMVFMIVAQFGARPLALSTGLVRFDGQPVLRPGKISSEALRFPYRG